MIMPRVLSFKLKYNLEKNVFRRLCAGAHCAVCETSLSSRLQFTEPSRQTSSFCFQCEICEKR